MKNTKPRPPLFVAWLSFERREAIAIWLRDKAAWAAEWIAPELHTSANDCQADGGSRNDG